MSNIAALLQLGSPTNRLLQTFGKAVNQAIQSSRPSVNVATGNQISATESNDPSMLLRSRFAHFYVDFESMHTPLISCLPTSVDLLICEPPSNHVYHLPSCTILSVIPLIRMRSGCRLQSRRSDHRYTMPKCSPRPHKTPSRISSNRSCSLSS